MKRFEHFEELLISIGIEFSSEVKYFNSELNSFLENIGSDIVETEEEPIASFKVEIEGRIIEIGVTSVAEEDDAFKNYYWLIDVNYIGFKIDKDTKDSLMKDIEAFNERYEDLKDKINIIKADGNLSKLCNLRTEFDETFDQFFDDKDLRKKYNDWDYDNECVKYEKSNADLLNELDEKDLREYIEFYKDYIGSLEDELRELKEREGQKQ